MKKVIFSALALSMVLFACNKKAIEPKIGKQSVSAIEHQSQNYTDKNDYSKLKVNEKGVLEFETIEYYEQLVNVSEPGNPQVDFLTAHIQENLKFNSLANTLQDRENDPFEDEFINSILNKDNVVKIGKWYIKLNPEKEKVYAVSEQVSNAYELVTREDETNGNTYTFTFDEEVLLYLADETLLNDRKWGCSDRRANKQDNNSPTKIITQVPYNSYMKVYVKFHKYGIYYTLKTKGIFGGVYEPQYLRFWFQLDNCSYAQRCGFSIENYSHPWISAPTQQDGFGGQKKKTYKFYQGTKDLKSYQFKVRLRCESTYGATINVPYFVIFTNYTLIADS